MTERHGVTMRCRHCKQEMFIQGVQTYPVKYHLKPIVSIECRNPECPLWKQTLNQADYPTMDLTPYLRKARR
jgi:hypothetical protein